MTENLPGSESLLPYARWAEDALRAVVLDALGYAAEHGLPGEHHFYLTFRTDSPGVAIPGHLKARYPQEMTIVLQHQFWDLNVTEHTFEVGLSFSGIPERLLIPFDALTGFFDPSVQFGLKFELRDKATETAAGEKPGKGPSPLPVELPKKPSVPVTRTAPKLPSKPSKPESDRASKAEKKATKAEPAKDKPDDDASAEVVSLDAFRKKN